MLRQTQTQNYPWVLLHDESCNLPVLEVYSEHSSRYQAYNDTH